MCSLQCYISSTPISFRTQKFVNSPHAHRLSLRNQATTSIDEIPPNAVRRKIDQNWRGGFSLGVDLGLSRTGIAISKGYTFKPLTVLKSRGQKLETRLLEIAEEEEVDEFIIGLPRSSDGKETIQSNKIRSVAGRLAVQAAERGWRVYVFDEHGTTSEASDRMIVMGLSKSERQNRSDAYAAVILLERYFSTQGLGTEIILPKSLELQEKIKNGSSVDPDFNPDKLEELDRVKRAHFTSADMREFDFSGSTFNRAYLDIAVAYKANCSGSVLIGKRDKPIDRSRYEEESWLWK